MLFALRHHYTITVRLKLEKGLETRLMNGPIYPQVAQSNLSLKCSVNHIIYYKPRYNRAQRVLLCHGCNK